MHTSRFIQNYGYSQSRESSKILIKKRVKNRVKNCNRLNYTKKAMALHFYTSFIVTQFTKHISLFHQSGFKCTKIDFTKQRNTYSFDILQLLRHQKLALLCTFHAFFWYWNISNDKRGLSKHVLSILQILEIASQPL